MSSQSPTFHKIKAAVLTALMAVSLSVLTSTFASASATRLPGSPSFVPTFDTSSAYLPFVDAEQDVAHRFVARIGAEKNLALLLLHAVKTDPAVKAAIDEHGMPSVQNTVVKAIKAAQGEFAADWSDVLASVYEDYLDDEALASILQEQEASPHFMTLLSLQDQIAHDVEAKGKAVFARARSAVMTRVRTQFGS